ncbi:MAG: sugar ABC transporter permease [Clostridia bacterium]|nr:sugar ABC transporter permease [Clostridia bacterium]
MKFKNLSVSRQEELTGYLFMLPFFIGFMIFQGFPFLITVFTSFTNMRFITKDLSKIKFVGFDNYISVLKDPDFINAFGRSLYFSVLYVVLIMMISMALAYFLNDKIFGCKLNRTLYFLPYISNIVAISVVWQLLLDNKEGPVNMVLKAIGIVNPPDWLVGNTQIVIPTIVIISVWYGLGLNLVTYLAALQEVPKSLYESADIDGANELQKFMNITVPWISPTTFFLLITSVIASMQNFAVIMSLTNGGPGNESTVLSIYTYQQAFNFNRMQMGATQSVYMLIVLALIAIIQWRGQKKWVHY